MIIKTWCKFRDDHFFLTFPILMVGSLLVFSIFNLLSDNEWVVYGCTILGSLLGATHVLLITPNNEGGGHTELAERPNRASFYFCKTLPNLQK